MNELAVTHGLILQADDQDTEPPVVVLGGYSAGGRGAMVHLDNLKKVATKKRNVYEKENIYARKHIYERKKNSHDFHHGISRLFAWSRLRLPAYFADPRSSVVMASSGL
jgi:hypothetical protein